MFGKNRRKNEVNVQTNYPENNLMDGIDEARIFEAATMFCKYLATIREQVEHQDRQMAQILELRSKDLAMLQKCFDAAADCQKQTAQIANSQIERHALNPAISAVDMLDDLITQIAVQADSITEIQPSSKVEKLICCIRESKKIAASQKTHLDIASIHPSEFDALDNDRHEIVSTTATEDKNMHKKIKETLKHGLIYRDAVLRHARVAVYRFKENSK